MSQSKENATPTASLKRNSTDIESPFAADSLHFSTKKIKVNEEPAVEEISDDDEEYKPESQEDEQQLPMGLEASPVANEEGEKSIEPADNTDYEKFKSEVLASGRESQSQPAVLGVAN